MYPTTFASPSALSTCSNLGRTKTAPMRSRRRLISSAKGLCAAPIQSVNAHVPATTARWIWLLMMAYATQLQSDSRSAWPSKVRYQLRSASVSMNHSCPTNLEIRW